MLQILIALLAFSSTFAIAQETGYVARIFAGYNHISMSFQPGSKMKMRDGQVLGAAVGFRWSDIIVTEAEASYRFNETEKFTIHGKTKQFIVPVQGDIKSFSLFGNIFCEFPTRSSLKMYIGAGLGGTAEYANWNINIIEDSVWLNYRGGSSFALSYQIIAGIRTPLADSYYCGVEFRVLDSVLDHMCDQNRSIIFTYHKIF